MNNSHPSILDYVSIDKWYIYDKSKKLEPGRICMAPHFFPEPNREYYLLKSYDPTKKPATCELSHKDKTSWTECSKRPIYGKLRLADDQEISCPRSKKRPVILLNPTIKPEGFVGGRLLKKTLMSNCRWLTLPLWSYKDDVLGHEELKIYVDCLAYPAFFPFPTCPVTEGERYPKVDSFGRIDYIQPLHESMLDERERTNFKVSLDIFDYLSRHIAAFINKNFANPPLPADKCESCKDYDKPDYFTLREYLKEELEKILPILQQQLGP